MWTKESRHVRAILKGIFDAARDYERGPVSRARLQHKSRQLTTYIQAANRGRRNNEWEDLLIRSHAWNLLSQRDFDKLLTHRPLTITTLLQNVERHTGPLPEAVDAKGCAVIRREYLEQTILLTYQQKREWPQRTHQMIDVGPYKERMTWHNLGQRVWRLKEKSALPYTLEQTIKNIQSENYLFEIEICPDLPPPVPSQ